MRSTTELVLGRYCGVCAERDRSVLTASVVVHRRGAVGTVSRWPAPRRRTVTGREGGAHGVPGPQCGMGEGRNARLERSACRVLVVARRPAGTYVVVERSPRQGPRGDRVVLVATQKTTGSCWTEE